MSEAPNAKPHRLFRFVTLPGNLVCEYVAEHNLVLIDRAKFDVLAKYQKEQVYNTTSAIEGLVPDTTYMEYSEQ